MNLLPLILILALTGCAVSTSAAPAAPAPVKAVTPAPAVKAVPASVCALSYGTHVMGTETTAITVNKKTIPAAFKLYAPVTVTSTKGHTTTTEWQVKSYSVSAGLAQINADAVKGL